jgi:hypothetical protein
MRRINSAAFRIATRGTSREINRQIGLNLVREKQPITRADLARLMGLTPVAVSLLVNDLRAGPLFEGARVKQGRTKPRHLIETRRRCALAIDISASHTPSWPRTSSGIPWRTWRNFRLPIGPRRS